MSTQHIPASPASPDGLSVAGTDRLYILRHDKFAVMAANAAQALEEEGGIPNAVELIPQARERERGCVRRGDTDRFRAGKGAAGACWLQVGGRHLRGEGA